MATSNRRVAAYLPAEIDEAFKAYKLKNGFSTEDDLTSNDSKALIEIIRQFLDVEYQVAHSVSLPDNLVTQEQLEELRNEFELKLSELLSELKRVTEEVRRANEIHEKSEPHSQLVMDVKQAESSVSASEEKVMTGEALSVRLGLSKSGVKNAKNRHKGDDQKFLLWSKQRDPDGLGWQYSEKDKKYRPVSSKAKTVS